MDFQWRCFAICKSLSKGESTLTVKGRHQYLNYVAAGIDGLLTFLERLLQVRNFYIHNVMSSSPQPLRWSPSSSPSTDGETETRRDKGLDPGHAGSGTGGLPLPLLSLCLGKSVVGVTWQCNTEASLLGFVTAF